MKKKAAEREAGRLRSHRLEAQACEHKGEWVVLAGYRPPDWPEPVHLRDIEDVDWLVEEAQYRQGVSMIERKRRRARLLKSRGLDLGQIAQKMGLSPNTVKDHLRADQMQFKVAA